MNTDDQQRLDRIIQMQARIRAEAKQKTNSDPDLGESQGLFGDSVDAFTRGAFQGLQGLGETAYQMAPERSLGKAIGKGVRDWAGRKADDQLAQMSPQMRESMGKELFTEDEDGDLALGDGISDPRTWIGTASQTLGQYVDVLVPGLGATKLGTTVLAKSAAKLAIRKEMKKGATEQVAQLAGKTAAENVVNGKARAVLSSLTYGGTGAASAGGMLGVQTREEVMQLPAEVLDQSEVFRQTYWQLADEMPNSDVKTLRQQATQLVADKAAAEVQRNPGLIASNFVMDAVGGKFIDELFSGVGTGSRLKNAAKQTGIQGLTEGAQGAVEQAASNVAIQENADPNRDIGHKVLANALTEGTFGGLTGGLVAAPFKGSPRPEREHTQESVGADAEPTDGQSLPETNEAGTEPLEDQNLPAEGQNLPAEGQNLLTEDRSLPEDSDQASSEEDSLKALRQERSQRRPDTIDADIMRAERMGFEDEATRLRNAKILYQRAMKQEERGAAYLAARTRERGHKIHRDIMEPVEHAERDALPPAPYTYQGEVETDIKPPANRIQPEGTTIDQAPEVQPEGLLSQQQYGLEQKRPDNRLEDQGIIYGQPPQQMQQPRVDGMTSPYTGPKQSRKAQARVTEPLAEGANIATNEPDVAPVSTASQAAGDQTAPNDKGFNQSDSTVNDQLEPPALDDRFKASSGVETGQQHQGQEWVPDPSGRQIWRSNDGQIITNESTTIDGQSITSYPVYASQKDRDQGDHYAAGKSFSEAKALAAKSTQTALDTQQQTSNNPSRQPTNQAQKSSAPDTHPQPTSNPKQEASQAERNNAETVRHRLDEAIEDDSPGLTLEEAKAAASELGELADKVKIIATPKELPAHIQLANMLQGIEPWQLQGVWDNGSIHIVASNADSTQDVIKTVIHEVVGHEGIKGLLGDRINPIMLQIYDAYRDHQALKNVQTMYPHLDARTTTGKIKLAEELLAHLAELQNRPKLLARVLSTIRYHLRKLFPNMTWTSADLYSLIESAREHVKRDAIKHRTQSASKQSLKAPFSPRPASAERYREQLKKSLATQGQTTRLIEVGDTPLVIQAVGAPNLSLQIKKDTVLKATNGIKHEVDMHDIERMPELLADPVMIFESATQPGSLVVLTEAMDASGKPVITAIHMSQRGRSALINRVASSYGKDSVEGFIRREIEGQRLRYAHTEKSRAFMKKHGLGSVWPQSIGAPIAHGGMSPDAHEMVLTEHDIVNSLNQHPMYKLRSNTAADEFGDLSTTQESALRKVGPKSNRQKLGEWARNHWDRAGTKIRQGMFDRYASLAELDQHVYGEQAFNENIQSSSWVRARMAANAGNTISAMVNHGRIYFDTKDKVIDVQEKSIGQGGLTGVLKQLGSAAEVERFMGWIAGNRAQKLMKEGRENLFTKAEADALATINTGKTRSGRERKDLYDKVFKEFQQYRDDVLSVAEHAGIITSENRAMWRDEFYVPFYRVSEDDKNIGGPAGSKGLSRQEAYKRLKGGSLELNDLLGNTIMNFHHLIDASLKNIAATQAIDNAVKVGAAERTVESARNANASTWIMREGKKQWYNIHDPLVYNSLTILNAPIVNSTSRKVMRAMKRFFTQSVTITPQFQVANLIRDSMQSIATSEMPYNPITNAIKGMKAYGIRHPEQSLTRARMLATGGSMSFGHIYGADTDAMKVMINGDLKSAKIISQNNVGQVFKRAWGGWQKINDNFENSNRAAIFNHNYREGNKLKAAFESRDLIDFSVHGAWPAVRFLIDTVPFMNARLQGLDKLYRTGVKPTAKVIRSALGGPGASHSDKMAARRFSIVSTAVSLAAMALYMQNKDDEDFQKLEDWQRDSYFFFKVGGNAFFIPRPFELGAIATFAERLLEQSVDDKATGKLFADRIQHMFLDTFSFNPVPQLFMPGLETFANHDTFTDRPIENMGMRNLSPSLRSRANTSKFGQTLSSGLEGIFGPESAVTLSPVQIDHLISGYLGQVGTWALAASDIAVRTAQGESTPEKAWFEYQPTRRFYKNLSIPGYTKYGTLFYDRLSEVRRINADIRQYRQLGELEKAASLARQHRNTLAARLTMERASRQLSKLNQRAKLIRVSGYDATYKRRELDRILEMRNRITEQVIKRLETSALIKQSK